MAKLIRSDASRQPDFMYENNDYNSFSAQICDWLDAIDPVSCSYDEWCRVGMALKYEGCACDLWDSWSRRDPGRYKNGECQRKWQTFSSNHVPAVTGATIAKMASDRGWDPMAVFSWDDPITIVAAPAARVFGCKDKHSPLEEPQGEWDGLAETKQFLQMLFKPNEFVGYCMQSRENGNRYVPRNEGTFHRKQQEITDAIDRFRDIPKALGSYNENAGAWVRINPLDGEGVNDKNVADFRYALVESDELSLEEQYAFLRRLQLPIAALVHSGNKSLHAVVHIGAGSDRELYKKRVAFLYDYCEKHGYVIDKQNKNPSRLMRLPGVKRGSGKQFLIPFTSQFHTYEGWHDAVETDMLPPFTVLGTVLQDRPPLKPVLIDGILRQGHKMMLSGASKAGKSFALMELCIAIAEGTKWLGEYDCARGRVLYVNLELDEASCYERFYRLYEALELPMTHQEDIIIWNLRGYAMPMEELVPFILKRAHDQSFAAIILDPIYKITNGDENSAQDMGKFCNELDHLATKLHCAVIYCHHYSKGSQNLKKVQEMQIPVLIKELSAPQTLEIA